MIHMVWKKQRLESLAEVKMHEDYEVIRLAIMCSDYGRLYRIPTISHIASNVKKMARKDKEYLWELDSQVKG